MACLDENQVLALVHGRLKGDELVQAQQHLDSCVDCLDLVGFYQQSAQGVEDEVETHDHDFVPLTESEEIDLKAPEGSKIGRYEVIRSLGRGGMGVVYLAQDPKLGRRVALKLVKPSLSSDERADHFEKRLMREARAMARLAHPNVLTIYDVGIQEGQVFMASEWVDGGTLDEWMKEGPHRWPAIAQRFREAARGLVAAHAAGLIHRDFKPSNVMVGKDERVRVFDFGLVKSTTANIGDITTQLSGNFVVGTPAYMAPEQMVGKTADERSDQFSFCASMYEALAGVRPFTGRNLTELLTNIGSGKLEEPKKIPKWLWEVIRRGLKKKPEDRHESMAVVLKIMDEGLSHRRRRSLYAAALVLVVGGAAAGVSGVWSGQDGQEAHCGDLKIDLGASWNPELRTEIENATLASPLPFAKESWLTTSGLIDTYAVDWKRELRASCIETRIAKQQSQALLQRRSDCFERLRSELAAVTSTLADGEPNTVTSMVALAQGLSPIDSCSATRAQDEFSSLAGIDERGAIRKLWPEVKTVESLIARGDYQGALVKSETLLAQTHGNRRAEARVLGSRGTALKLLGDYKGAVTALESSFYAAVAGRHDEIAAQATTHIYGLTVVLLKDDDGASRWLQLAESAVERVSTPLVQGHWRRVQGKVALARKDYSGAEEHFRASLEFLEGALGPEHREVATAVGALGRCLLLMDDKSRATPTLERAVTLWSALAGPEHPDTAVAQIDLAAGLSALGRGEAAKTLVENSIRALVVALGEDNPTLAWALNSMAEHYVADGDYAAASQTLLRALRAKRALHGNSHPLLVSTLTNLMEVDRMLGRSGDAVIHGSEAVEILLEESKKESTFAIRHLQIAVAEARLASGDLLGADEICTQLQSASEKDDASQRGRVLTCLASTRLARGDKREGRVLLTEALAAFGSAGARHRAAVAIFMQAKLNYESKATRPDGVGEARAALRHFEVAGPAWAREREQVSSWLAEVEGTNSTP
jgi:tetratricopeptide (TPR) repeat protein